MDQFNQKICALPECSKIINGRGYGSCCCQSHQKRYAAKKRHGTLGKPNQTKEEYQEWLRKYRREWYQQSKELAYKRRDLKHLTPKWADIEKINEIYVKARSLSQETGITYEVDHIVPLTHKLVCGLHVESNLQILTERENCQKSNKFIVE
jgi:hypothetical protein